MTSLHILGDGSLIVTELWSKSINPSELFNVERTQNAGPEGGGGQLYFQVPRNRVSDTLKFLKAKYSELPIPLAVRALGMPDLSEELVFHKKSQRRMRTGPQNRQRGQRLTAWSSRLGFPCLRDDVGSTNEANELLNRIGGLRIFLARSEADEVWAGFTTGTSPPSKWPHLPFNDCLFGLDQPGGHWVRH